MSSDEKKKSLMPKFNLTMPKLNLRNPLHLRTARRKTVATILAAATIFGGGSYLSYDYLNNSKDTIRATVTEKTEYISSICGKEATRSNINYSAKVTKPDCLKNVRYTVTTNKGEFRNDPSVLFGKLSAKKLQDKLEIGTEYDFPITGKDAGKIGALPNILEAKIVEPEISLDEFDPNNPDQFEQNQGQNFQGQQQQQFIPQEQGQNFYPNNNGLNQNWNLNKDFNGSNGQNGQIRYNGQNVQNVPNYPVRQDLQGGTYSNPTNIKYPNIGSFDPRENKQSNFGTGPSH